MKIPRSNDLCNLCAAVSRGDRSVQHRHLHYEGAFMLSQYLVSTSREASLAHDILESICGSFSFCLSFFPLPPCALIYLLSCHPIFHSRTLLSLPLLHNSLTSLFLCVCNRTTLCTSIILVCYVCWCLINIHYRSKV